MNVTSAKSSGGRRCTSRAGSVSWLGVVVLVLLMLAAGADRAGAQDAASQREQILDEPFRLVMDQDVPAAKRAVFGWGGWFRSSVWDADDNVDRNFDGRDDGRGVLRRQQLRLWGQFTIDQVHQFYARGRLDYRDWNDGARMGEDPSDWDGPDLDRLWYSFRWSQAQRSYGYEPGELDLAVKVGRQYVLMGTGWRFRRHWMRFG